MLKKSLVVVFILAILAGTAPISLISPSAGIAYALEKCTCSKNCKCDHCTGKSKDCPCPSPR